MLSHSFETPNEKFALEKLKRSIKFKSGRYEVLVPWKDDRSVLPDNYETALRCLRRTEKRILKEPEERLRKEDPKNREKPIKSCCLPHVSVMRPDEATAETNIVSDASAKCKGIF